MAWSPKSQWRLLMLGACFSVVTICMFCLTNYNSLSRAKGKKPVLYIHVGPHKSGSTHIQKMLIRFSKQLKGKGIFWPEREQQNATTAFTEKELAYFAWNVEDNCYSELSAVVELSKFLLAHAKLGHSCVISSEILSGYSLKTAQELRKMYGGVFLVRVIIVYRPWLASWISVHNEILKSNLNPKFVNHHSLLASASWPVTNIFSRPGTFLQVVRNYVATFGRDNVHIIDYYGAQKAKKDVAFVILCDIMGSLCDADTHTAASIWEDNLATDVIQMQMTMFVIEQGLLSSCLYSDNDHSLFVTSATWNCSIPTSAINIDFYHLLSDQLDWELRDEFLGLFLYNDRHSWRAATALLGHSEVNRTAVLTGPCHAEILRMLAQLRSKGFCDYDPHFKPLDIRGCPGRSPPVGERVWSGVIRDSWDEFII